MKLWAISNQKQIEEEIKERKWKWIGHTLRKDKSIAKEALEWNPDGKRKVGRPATTWRKTVMDELKKEKKTFGEIKKLAQNRVRWRKFVVALCSKKE